MLLRIVFAIVVVVLLLSLYMLLHMFISSESAKVKREDFN